MAKKNPNSEKKTLPTVSITAKKKIQPTRVDSISVGGVKRSTWDISKALGALNKSGTSKQYVKGVSATNPVSSSKTLSAKSSTSDVVNKMIDSSKKKPNYIAKKK